MQDDILADLDPDLLALLLEQSEEKDIAPVTGNIGPLSFLQEKIWSLQTILPDSNAYNMPVVFKVSGYIDAVRLEKSLNQLIEKHDSFRTVVRDDENGHPQLEVCESFDFQLICENVSLPAQSYLKSSQLKSWLAAPFKLRQAPLLKAKLITCEQNEQILALSYHHLASDAWSNQHILRDLKLAYLNHTLNPSILRYIDFSNWQKSSLDAHQAAVSFWQSYLTGFDQPLMLPIKDKYGVPANYSGASYSQIWDADLGQQIQTFCKTHQLTPFAFCHAVWQLVLYRHTGHNQFSVGVPNASRNHEQLQDLVGCFITMQAYRCEVRPECTILEIAHAVQKHAGKSIEHSGTPFEYVQQHLNLDTLAGRATLFQTGFDCQQSELVDEINFGEFQLSPQMWNNTHSKQELYNSLQFASGGVKVEIEYRTALYEAQFISKLMSEYQSLIKLLMSKSHIVIGNLLDNFSLVKNDIPMSFSSGYNLNNVVDTIEAAATQYPNNVALAFGDASMTYQELERKSTQLARLLIDEGVKPESRIALCFDRSIEMVISIVGVLKAGCAYVPIEPSLPQERQEYILSQSGAQLLLQNDDVIKDAKVPVRIFSQLSLEQQSVASLSIAIHPEQLAYIIFTSGSTGKPKGVGNSHGALFNRIQWQQNEYKLSTEDTVLQKTPFGFDVSVWEFLWPLMQGATLAIAQPGAHKDPEALLSEISAHKVTTLHFVPSMLQAFIASPDVQSATSLKRILCSGEALPSDVQARAIKLLPHIKLYNLYGPTEAAIDVTHFTCHGNADRVVPIGRAIDGCELFILSSDLNLAPKGSTGELYIGGVGLARGYEGRSELTAERFIANPFKQDGQRLYRTGDLVRWNDFDELEYLGRTDHQIKIRGLRIELGEIESVLYAQKNINEAVVVAQEVKTSTRLVAFVSGRDINVEELKAHLVQVLPDYMVPNNILELEALPLSPNGKVDRKALPLIEVGINSNYVAPIGPVEQVLVDVWQKVLGIEKIGRQDNFFELGGDSIISLQIVALLRKHQLAVSAQDMFSAQTIANLSELVKPVEEHAISQTVSGNVALLPIQQAFFEQDFEEKHHWNQAVMLKVPGTIESDALSQALAAIISHHDSLRLEFNQVAENQWQQAYRDYLPGDEESLIWHHCVSVDKITELAQEAQISLSINDGPLMRLVHMQVEDGTARLLFVIHHLLVDGVSWRVILEDFKTAYNQVCAKSPIELTAKSHSYKFWAQKLQSYPEKYPSELIFWRSQQAKKIIFPSLNPDGSRLMADTQSVSLEFDKETTHALLHSTSSTYRTQVNDILLSALSRAVFNWTGQKECLINLEGHGRETWDNETDLSRTVGWFTALYPVKLTNQSSLKRLLQNTKEHLRKIPNKGIGYGAHKYFGEQQARLELHKMTMGQIEFNYLGQFDNSFDHSSGNWQPALESPGSLLSDHYPQQSELVINGQVFNGKLKLAIRFGRDRLLSSEVEKFANFYEKALKELVNHCKVAENRLTPSDVPLASLTQTALDELADTKGQIVDLYLLSPMQQGMMFHSVYGSQTAYVNQMRMDITHLNVTQFKSAWQSVVARHDVLRTGFTSHTEIPLQFVVKSLETNWQELDLSSLQSDKQISQLSKLAKQQLEKGFDLEKDVGLNRIVLLKVSDQQHHLIWTCHHIIMDGWSRSLFMGELLAAYQGRPLTNTVTQYRDYIKYLTKQDLDINLAYWREQVGHLTAPCYLSKGLLKGSAGKYGQCNLEIDVESTARLDAFARKNRVTLNTLVQGAWAVIISRYLRQSRVCFGTTTAGRPTELANSDLIQGLFINTIPVISHINNHMLLSTWLAELQIQSSSARGYEYTPLYDIQNIASEYFELDKQGLFDTLLVFENYPIAESLKNAQPNGTFFDIVKTREETSYALTLTVANQGNLSIKATYQGDKLAESAVTKIINELSVILLQMIDNKTKYIGNLNLVSDPEVNAGKGECVQVLDSFVSRFNRNVHQQPNATALRSADSEMSYAELEEKSSRLADALNAKGVGYGKRVGIHLHRGFELVIAVLAALRSGVIYVPIDPSLPFDRKNYIVDDSKLDCILSESYLELTQTMIYSVNTMLSDQSISKISCDTRLTAQDSVYLLYTSGSTGKPKGVTVKRCGLDNYLSFASREYLKENMDSLVNSTLSFDATITSLLTPLWAGSAVNLLPQEEDGLLALSQYISSSEQANLFKITPAHIDALLHTNTLKTRNQAHCFVVGGDKLLNDSASKFMAFFPNSRLINEYGPTETVVGCSTYEFNERHVACYNVMPVTHAIANTQLYILDDALNHCTVNTCGELYIAGDGLAEGYWQRYGLTAERFVANPFSSTGQRMYRTGDLVRRDDYGEIEFLGRLDNQVKIRGHRIELGEIESALMALSGVSEVVIDVTDIGDTKHLVAYIVATDFNEQNFKTILQANLPDYMVPTYFVPLACVPLTLNGKVDKLALPKPNITLVEEYAPPQGNHESEVAQIWQIVLGAEKVGRFDNFFKLGGDSISSLRVIAKLKQIGKHATVAQLLDSDSLAQFSAKITEQESKAENIVRQKVRFEGLSYAQLRQWFLWKLDPRSSAYHIAGALTLKGQLDRQALNHAFEHVLTKHESLRTQFVESNYGDVTQIVNECTKLNIELLSSNELCRIESFKTTLTLSPFDLTKGNLFRVGLIELDKYHHELHVVMHHIISDGWSLKLIVDDFVSAYAKAVNSNTSAPEPERLRYSDFAYWQRQWLDANTESAQFDFWRTTLGDEYPVLNLPYDRTLSSVDRTAATLDTVLTVEQVAQFNDYAHSRKHTLFSVMMAAWQVTLYRFTGQREIRVGVPVANRNHGDTHNIVGSFVNTIVIANSINSNTTLSEFIDQVSSSVIAAQANQDLPFERLLDGLNIPRDTEHSPIFQVTMNHQRVEDSNLDSLPGLTVEMAESAATNVQFDLALNTVEQADGSLKLSIEYLSSGFSPQRITQLQLALLKTLQGFIDNPAMCIGQLDLLNTEHIAQLQGLGKGAVKLLNDVSILDDFYHSVAQAPHAVAIHCGQSKLSYLQLDTASNQLAHYLVEQGICAEQSIGLMFERSAQMIISMLAILKAGAVYVPIDPSLPKGRVQYIIEHAQLQTVLTNIPQGNENKAQFIQVNGLALDYYPSTYMNKVCDASQLGYILYTSGSTGKPKGVAVSHGNLLNFIRSMRDTFESNPTHSWLALTSLSFDISGLEIYLPLSSGGSLHLVDSVMSITKKTLSNVTHIQATPAGWRSLLAQNVLGDKKIGLSGGESLSIGLASSLQAHNVTLFNMYGPTETTIWSSMHRVEGECIHLGNAIANTQLYVLDPDLNVCPESVIGELYISGSGLARGYLDNPLLSAQSFIANPFENDGSRLYRTGDLVRWQDSSLVYLGRTDHQVKIRGFRIELGEISSLLEANTEVETALVIAEKSENTTQLIAYVSGEGIDTAKLKANLSEKLPEYMIPSNLVVLDSFPLNSSGKIDRSALPKPELLVKEYQPPVNDLESSIAQIWQSILGIQSDIGRLDNFFALGGDSIASLRVISQVNAQFNVAMKVRDMFDSKDLSAFARGVQFSINQLGESYVLKSVDDVHRATVSQEQRSLWLTDRLSSEVDRAAYNIAGGVSISGLLDTTKLQNAFEKVIRRHDSLRSKFDEVDGDVAISYGADSTFKLSIKKLDDLAGCKFEQSHKLRQEFIAKPFDLSKDLLIRAELISFAEDEHHLVVSVHHIISDGWSIANLVKEVGAFYKADVNAEAVQLPELKLQYGDYAYWQQQKLVSPDREQVALFWQKQLSDSPEQSVLPLHYPRTSKVSSEGAAAPFTISGTQYEAIKRLANDANISDFTILMASYYVFLHQQTGQRDFILGTDLAGREHVDLEPIIGYFIKVLPVRLRLNLKLDFSSLCKELQLILLDIQSNQLLSLEGVFQSVKINRNTMVTPLFQQLFVMQNTPEPQWPVADLTLAELPATSYTSKFDAAVFLMDRSSKFTGNMVYKTALYNSSKMAESVEQWLSLQSKLVAESKQPLNKLLTAKQIGKRLKGKFSSLKRK